jgi:circadian clock protein KaiB
MTPVKRSKPSRRRPVDTWDLRLYVTDDTPRSRAAIANLRSICDTHLKGRFRITTIDLAKSPERAKGDQILATPTLVRRVPIPTRTIIGNLSDIDNALAALDLNTNPHPGKTAESRKK